MTSSRTSHRPVPARRRDVPAGLSRRRALQLGASALAGVVLPPAVGGALAAGCASDSGSATTGSRVSLPFSVELDAGSAGGSFDNALGWRVQLDALLVSLGPIYMYEGAPVTWLRRLQDVLVPSAHAHPGHYVPGDVLAEYLEPTSLDLLAGTRELGLVNGVTGLAQSASFSFQTPPAGPFADTLAGDVLHVTATGSLGDQRVSLTAHLSTAELGAEAGNYEVIGCPLTGGELTPEGRLVLAFAPDVWFDQVDFGDVPADAPAGEPLAEDNRALRSLIRGLEKAASYQFRFVPD